MNRRSFLKLLGIGGPAVVAAAPLLAEAASKPRLSDFRSLPLKKVVVHDCALPGSWDAALKQIYRSDHIPNQTFRGFDTWIPATKPGAGPFFGVWRSSGEVE